MVCPLSGTVFPNIKELFQSLKSGYGLDIQTVLASYESEYDRVKVVNFVRAQVGLCRNGGGDATETRVSFPFFFFHFF